jgi:ribosomal protein L11 methyltransferase
MTASPALLIRFHVGTTAPVRDRLVALLSDFDLVAIQEDDLSAPSEWIAHFASADSRDAAAVAIAGESEFALIEVSPTDVEDEDWARRTQADLPAIRIGRIIVAPPWDLPKATDPSAIVVLIEPSRGFGTGHHQSTRLCLALLQAVRATPTDESHRLPAGALAKAGATPLARRELAEGGSNTVGLAGLTVMDVGTGSGVLAITAAKLGAAFVTAIDTDPDAVENARENIVANAVDKIVEAHVDDLTTTSVRPADLVTANLTGTLLTRHADDLTRLVRPGGSLIVSGFNIDEKRRVEEALATSFVISETAEEDDWFAFVLTRRGGH